MGFLDNLFSSGTKSLNEKRLIECVDKIDKQDSVFVNVMNDLGSYVERVGDNDTNMRKMAYAYARRIAAAGLCAQGIWGQEEYDYILTLFHSFQQMTEHSVEFQEKAAAQAVEYIQSYDMRLNRHILMSIVTLMSQDASRAKNNGKVFSVDEIIKMFNS